MIRYLALFCLLATAVLIGCRKDDEFTKDPSATLRFSTDTVMFDTVFTQVGQQRPLSITKQFWVINPNNKGVKVTIFLAGNIYGLYKLNIDGEATDRIQEKEIRANDSIAVFVQVYLNSVNQNTPFIVTDQIVFETNGNKQDIDLVAYAQDAIYLNNQVLSCAAGNLHWTADKPYVIYDSVLVPKGCILTIDAGARIHSHVQSSILIAGTLVVNGTSQRPVVFEGDRLDPDYRNRAGQWAGIRLLAGSVNNAISYATIKNGVIGLQVDSASANENPNLLLRNSTITNMLAAGLLGYSSEITAINNVISDCGQFTFYGALGGNYRLYYNTFSSSGIFFNRQNPQFLLDNSPLKNEAGAIIASFPLSFTLYNNIIYGSEEEEIIINQNAEGAAITADIRTNLIRTKLPVLNTGGNLLNIDPQFVNVQEQNLRLQPTSPAKTKATPITITTDFTDAPRGALPTIGAYE
ncbi:MAG: right-handed parallel beta-helix repeat-containing protein [Bacteroidia bacterium]|nr:right-handed parallel beta-helix repeat-containing protein [Bacteroidia bacterium]